MSLRKLSLGLALVSGALSLFASRAQADVAAPEPVTTLSPGMVGAYSPPPAGHRDVVVVLGGTPQGNQAARADNWPKALAFLDAAFAGRSCR